MMRLRESMRHISKVVFQTISFFILGMNLYAYTPCYEKVGSCDYYLCREEIHQCGERKYFVDLGYKYCSKYMNETYHKVGEASKAFLERNAICLQAYLEEMQDSYSMSCSKIKRRAIDSHAYCYYKSGYCDLPEKDQSIIIGTARVRWLLPSSISEGIKLHRLCKERPEVYSLDPEK